MPVETPTLSPTGGPAEGQAPPRPDEPFAGALQEVFRALQKTSIYPPGHPSIRGAIARAAEQIGMALEGRSAVRIGVAREHVLVDREPITNGPAVLASLAQFLNALNVGILEIRTGLTTDELERFLFRLREARGSGLKGAALAGLLAGDRLDHLAIVPLDYQVLSFSAHADAERVSTGADKVWDGLVVNLSQLASEGIRTEPESLAQEANSRFSNDDGVGGGLLRTELRTLGSQLRRMDNAEQEALRTRLGRFVQALSPALRQDLLRLDAQDPEGSMSMLADLSEGLPDSTLLDILRDLNRSGQRAHDQFLGFLNKMARLPAPDGAAVPDLASARDRWGSGGIIEEDPRSFREALRAVITLRESIACNPESYQQHLDGLTRRELPAVTQVLCSRYRDPSDADDVRAQVVELAVFLLSDGEGKEHVPGIIAHIGASTDRLLETGFFEPVGEAAATVSAIHASEELAPEIRLATKGFLLDFSSAARVDRILDHALAGGHAQNAAESLLTLGGAGALERILERLSSSTAPDLSAFLPGVAARMGGEPITAVIERRWEKGWDALEPLFKILRHLPAQDALSALDLLASHPESRVRREVLANRCEIDRSQAERHLRTALADPDLRFVNLVIQRLSLRSSRESLDTLAAFVEGTATATIPTLDHVKRAAEGMAERGDVGVHRLSGCLHGLRRTFRPSRAAAGATVRQVLEPYRSDSLVSRAIDKWRKSPAALVARLIPAPRPAGERE